MRRFTELLCELGEVTCLDYPYRLRGSKLPDPLPRLIEAHRQALRELEQRTQGPIILIGKSMGGRVGCHVSLETPTQGQGRQVNALVCLGYPLRGQGKRAALRDQVLKQLRTAVLFVQGSEDPLCPLPLLEATRLQMAAPSELLVLEGADHSLALSRAKLARMGTTQAELERRIIERIGRFVEDAVAGRLPRT
jgi:predicted alpha/beta-hydrolase family hydrolase